MGEGRFLPGCPFRPWLPAEEPAGPAARQRRPGGRFAGLQPGAAPASEFRETLLRGRVRVALPSDHEYANSGGWQYRARLLLCYELKRRLETGEHVDHINGDKLDDRIENLRLVAAELHGRHHAYVFELAGCRDEDGRFCEIDLAKYAPAMERANRLGPIVGTGKLEPLSRAKGPRKKRIIGNPQPKKANNENPIDETVSGLAGPDSERLL